MSTWGYTCIAVCRLLRQASDKRVVLHRIVQETQERIKELQQALRGYIAAAEVSRVEAVAAMRSQAIIKEVGRHKVTGSATCCSDQYVYVGWPAFHMLCGIQTPWAAGQDA
jgi:hypothetical protein